MAEGKISGAITHLAGVAVFVGPLLRQRCAWCGALLIDEDLDRVQVMISEGRESSVPTWKPGTLVTIDGSASWMLDHEDGAEFPASACVRLDPEVTA